MWIKRGDFILVEPIEEGVKVKAEICKILTSEHIKEYTKANIWPERFIKKSNQHSVNSVNNGDLEPNMNRPVITANTESSEDSDEDED